MTPKGSSLADQEAAPAAGSSAAFVHSGGAQVANAPGAIPVVELPPSPKDRGSAEILEDFSCCCGCCCSRTLAQVAIALVRMLELKD
ncbi:hypothetical protein QR680_003813 [Steinernema hermaphroditum]|uniref:Uncharacterized protein n=1 Tax=Steinernema hermaphroditum TaxID=289476 RepID=A0AA39HLM5_9BILA|nr:hypothetical protein QR680_003813 [Steinernema hermaphroditum]